MHANINFLIEFLGTISFAMSGSFAAMQRRLDPFGILIIAFVTSVGGGTVRDLLLAKPVFWMHDLWICGVIFVTCVISMIFKSIEQNFRVTLFIFDSFGLGLFTIIGIQKGMSSELHPIICITLGTITGCFGGIIRDILLNRIPLIFRKEIYATACILGGATFILLATYTHLSYPVVQIFTILLIVTIRTLAVKYHWQMPKFYIQDK
ncbi:trimeric intracellular cation channel family protein [Riemerella anatipestifer]|uniref:trimeric intracellular cation channel family protein n=1 Tax=Riemerella anatipestifer TaxID=34085 RepID=UPI002A85A929|nr:trimeric intracellular cation channel family protein [Riemerella anatipestifer]MDY3521743.1 trimeric intracellular cation channel family protein [Riemerella anatipestifer]MDY3533954.1 trimeric intracellular cation channel family protein [Riemerella anatipestifer]MDY3536168.1 trimeric intracellular cation channel family protein [Riemerella anatipestifer]